MCLKVIGAGFGRTGTYSLKMALETLGFGPCYHMYEVGESNGHVGMWNSVIADGTSNWDVIFENYRSAVDWPTCAYWKELWSQYKNAKFVLTVRDPEEWYEAASNTIFKAIEIGRHLKDQKRCLRCEMSGELILEKTFSGRQSDKDFVISKYLKHIKEVKSTISKNQLLEFDITEGWEPLCNFLNVQVPKTDFPLTNTREEFLKALLNGNI